MNKITYDEMLKYSSVLVVKILVKLEKEKDKLEKENKELKDRIRKALNIVDIYGTYRLETADLLYNALKGE